MGKRGLWESESGWRASLNEIITATDKELNVEPDTPGVKRHLLFTTFQLDLELFETQILCNLPGVDDCGSLRDPSRLHKLEQFLDNTSVTVLHDSRALVNSKSRSSVTVLPVHVERGVFHPKIVLYGVQHDSRSELGILIGSANLTHSGIGVNRESIFGLAGKLHGKLCAGMSSFLSDLKRVYLAGHYGDFLEDIDHFIEQFSKRRDDRCFNRSGVSLFATGPGIKDTDSFKQLKKMIRRCSDFICWVPYFPDTWSSENPVVPSPVAVLEQNRNSDEDSVWFCPAVNREGKYYLDPEFVNYCNDFGLFQIQQYKSEKGKFRFRHAKLYRLEYRDKVVMLIGSHNLTVSAWGGVNSSTGYEVKPVNIEVSLILECTGDFKRYDTGIDESAYKELKGFEKSEGNEDEIQDDNCLATPPLSVTFDWRDRRYSIRLFDPGRYFTYSMQLPFIGTASIAGSEREQYMDVTANAIMLTDMSYTVDAVKADGEHTDFKGVVLEINRSSRAMAYDNLNAYMKTLAGKIQPDERGFPKGKSSTPKNGKKGKRSLFDEEQTWYDFFHEAESLCERIAAEQKNGCNRHLCEFRRLYSKELSDADNLDWLTKVKLWLLYKQVEISVGPCYELLTFKPSIMMLKQQLNIKQEFEFWVEACLHAAEREIGLEKEAHNG